MAIEYDLLMRMPPLEIAQSYSARDSILYALGVGAGLAAADAPDMLRYVYEKDLAALPTMALVLAYPGFWAKDPKFGITWQKLLHARQSVEWHDVIPPDGQIRGVMTVDALYDRGPDKGAVLHFSRRIYDQAGDRLLATVRQVNLLRADGGFGGPAEPVLPPRRTPDGAADLTAAIPTSRDAALLYRLSGDYNPLHADPEVARAAGFERPILHGLASFGAVGRVLLQHLCDNRPDRMRRMEVQFSAPVYPGETFLLSAWRTAPGHYHFEAKINERDALVLKGGALEVVE